MHLVGYLYEAYHDPRSLEHKVAGTSIVEDAATVGVNTWVASGLACDLLAGCYRYGNEPPVFRIS
jgi:hypothetical protein